jgi:phosphatidylserine decarboxylase
LLQHLLPQKTLSRLVFAATRWQFRPWKDFLIRTITRRFSVDLAEAADPRPAAFLNFNAFFTRALKAGARSADSDPDTILMPADGRISELGRIEGARLLQAKGRWFTLEELLAGSDSTPFRDGSFATIYLSPRDYHRVHMPWQGRLIETLHVPGRLFSVAPFTVAGIDRLFARNERLVCRFDSERGPFVVIMVGAILVSGIETVWRGVEVPPYASHVIRRSWTEGSQAIALDRFAEMARFNMGSTAIVLLPPGPRLVADWKAGDPVRVGQALARW